MSLFSILVKAKDTKNEVLPDNLQEFLQQLVMPEPFGRPGFRLIEERGNSHSLCFYAPGSEPSYLNAGYTAGQAASYLRFLGADVHLRLVRHRFRPAKGRNSDIAVLTYSMPKKEDEPEKSNEGGKTYPFLFSEWGRDWNKKLLDMVIKSPEIKFGVVHMECGDNMIRLTTNPTPVKREDQCEFEAGVALANVMVTGERMWMDLDMQVTEHATDHGSRQCTVCVFPTNQGRILTKTEAPKKTISMSQAFSSVR